MLSATSTPASAAAELVRFMRREIPMAQVMDVGLVDHERDQLTLAAPLRPNVNDKGCAFGGSLVSIMTLAGWGLVELALRARGDACDLYVGTSDVRYLAPVLKDFRCVARLAGDADWDAFFAALDARGKAGIDVACHIPTDAGDGAAATLAARFVAKRRQPAA